MNKPYLIIFMTFLIVPVLLSAAIVTYLCFEIGMLTGFIALGICLLVMVGALILIIIKMVKSK